MGLAEKKFVKDAIQKLESSQIEIRKLLAIPELVVELDVPSLERWLEELPEDADYYKDYISLVAFDFNARKTNCMGNYADFCLFVDYALLSFMEIDSLYREAVLQKIRKVIISVRPYIDFYSDAWNLDIVRSEKPLDPPLLVLEDNGTLKLNTFNFSVKGYLGDTPHTFLGTFPNFFYLEQITPEHAQKYFAPFTAQLENLLS